MGTGLTTYTYSTERHGSNRGRDLSSYGIN